MREVSDRLALSEGVKIPDTVPAELLANYSAKLGSGAGAAAAEVASQNMTTGGSAASLRPRAGFVRN
jgi:hypothetical protein